MKAINFVRSKVVAKNCALLDILLAEIGHKIFGYVSSETKFKITWFKKKNHLNSFF